MWHPHHTFKTGQDIGHLFKGDSMDLLPREAQKVGELKNFFMY